MPFVATVQLDRPEHYVANRPKTKRPVAGDRALKFVIRLNLDCTFAFAALQLIEHRLAPVHVGVDVIPVQRSDAILELTEDLLERCYTNAVDEDATLNVAATAGVIDPNDTDVDGDGR